MQVTRISIHHYIIKLAKLTKLVHHITTHICNSLQRHNLDNYNYNQIQH